MKKIWLILEKELRVLSRDRRLMFGVVVTSLLALPALFALLGRLSDPKVPVAFDTSDAVLNEVLSDREDLLLIALEDSIPQGALVIRLESGVYRIVTEGKSAELVGRARSIARELEASRGRLTEQALREQGITRSSVIPFDVEVVDLADQRTKAGRIMGILLPYLIIVLLASNAIRAVYIAVGEKEKNTLAPLLVSMVPRYAIVVGKSLAIMAFAVVAAALLILGMVGFAKLGFTPGPGMSGVDLAFSGRQVMEISLNVLTLALFIASVVMVLGTVARSQREAGIYTAPLVFVTIFLAVFSFSSSGFPTAAYAVPVLGNSLALKDSFLGSLSWANLLIPVSANLVLSLALVRTSVAMYNREAILFRQ